MTDFESTTRLRNATGSRLFALARKLLGAAAFLSLAACGADREERSAASWELVFEDLDPALLSVWGDGADDVWVVGSDAGDGPEVLHFDGNAWDRLATGESGNLWWVAGDEDAIWMVGEDGLILRHEPGTGSFEAMTPPETGVVLFGILPLAPDDVWAVGGDVVENRGVIWHYDGAAWTEDTDAKTLAAEAGALFKVWGQSSDDLFVVGIDGAGLRRTSSGWETTPIPTDRSLFTVHGSGDDVVAVGGNVSGLIVEWDGNAWVDVSPAAVPQLNGVYVEPSGRATAVGIEGSIWRREAPGEAWAGVEGTPEFTWDYHGAYVDPAGGTWVVGGYVATEPLKRGALAHQGAPVSGTVADAAE